MQRHGGTERKHTRPAGPRQRDCGETPSGVAGRVDPGTNVRAPRASILLTHAVRQGNVATMRTDDESCLIGGVVPREIVIAEYDPAWPARYEAHARAIHDALGGTLLRIEHVGSASVPGLAAKPIIDILAVVPDSGTNPPTSRSSARPGTRCACASRTSSSTAWRTAAHDVHLHVYSPGAPEIARMIAFRDWLRRSAEDRARYEAVKRRLAAQRWPDMNAYADAKTGVVESIMAAAADEESRRH